MSPLSGCNSGLPYPDEKEIPSTVLVPPGVPEPLVAPETAFAPENAMYF